MSLVRSQELPIDLVQALRLQDSTRDDALSLGGSHGDLETTEEQVEAGLNVWSIATAFDCESGAIVGPFDISLVLLFPELGIPGLIELEGGIAAQGRHIRTSCSVERIASGVCLRQGSWKHSHEKGDGRESKRIHGGCQLAIMDLK